MIASDGHARLNQVRQACFPGVRWKRCQLNLQQNSLDLVPKVSMREPVAEDLRAIFNGTNAIAVGYLLNRTADENRELPPMLGG